MFKKLFLSLLLIPFLVPSFVFAQEEENLEEELHAAPVQQVLEAVINVENNNVEVEKKSIKFDASKSLYNDEEDVTFTWDLGDGMIVSGMEILHTYKTVGKHVVRLTVSQGDKEDSSETLVFSYEKLLVLISNTSHDQEKILQMIETNKVNGVFIDLVSDFNSSASTENLVQKIAANSEDIKNTDIVIVWPDKVIDFSILTSYQEGSDIDFSEKTFVFITDENLGTVANFSQNIYEIIQPKKIIITRKESLPVLAEAKSIDEFLENIQKRLVDFEVIDENSSRWEIFNIFSVLIQFMLRKNIPIILILILPIIATAIAFMRQVVGLKTIGIYTPSIITLSLIVLGIKFGLFILALIVIFGTLIRVILNKFHLLYSSKVGVILTVSSFIIFLVIAMGTYFEIGGVSTIAVFPMLIMITLGEKFTNLYTEKGFKSAFLVTGETVVVTVLCYFFVTWGFLQTLVISYPGSMYLIAIVLNIVLGRYTGLRLSEYIRFRSLFIDIEEE